eukprot:TRINITY_DN1370_c0_g1_i4.p1 TRINITY_DN1370_c0_g1~~TRINITY_DN1370_c0_g1_i4.p1  ORF type:complete len:273 (+),score=58.32 TRINITY_DN1370_c0_g1_i4:1107-1925(+)
MGNSKFKCRRRDANIERYNNMKAAKRLKKDSIKIGIFGDSGCGKSAIGKQYFNNEFDEYLDSEIEQKWNKDLSLSNGEINMEVIVLIGQEEYSSIKVNYLNGSDIVILVYSIICRRSFTNICNKYHNWKTLLKDKKSTKFVLVGSKSDLEEKREVQKDLAEKFSKDNNMLFLEVSSKTGKNIDQLFIYSTKYFYEDNIQVWNPIHLNRESFRSFPPEFKYKCFHFLLCVTRMKLSSDHSLSSKNVISLTVPKPLIIEIMMHLSVFEHWGLSV